jgi:Holliday junction DNA helicase RuvA
MIAHVRGTVAAVTLNSAVIDVGGVGMRVMCTPGTVASLRMGQETQLSTSMVVREDSLTIFGFASPDERDMFELVQSASGVGPKVAQAMLAALNPDRLRQAIGQGDVKTLTSVPGIGRKGAERIIVELKDRVGGATGVVGVSAAWRDQVHEALLGLGWNPREADAALDAVAANHADGAEPDVAQALREALQALSKDR